jgi:hypothetical protein
MGPSVDQFFLPVLCCNIQLSTVQTAACLSVGALNQPAIGALRPPPQRTVFRIALCRNEIAGFRRNASQIFLSKAMLQISRIRCDVSLNAASSAEIVSSARSANVAMKASQQRARERYAASRYQCFSGLPSRDLQPVKAASINSRICIGDANQCKPRRTRRHRYGHLAIAASLQLSTRTRVMKSWQRTRNQVTIELSAMFAGQSLEHVIEVSAASEPAIATTDFVAAMSKSIDIAGPFATVNQTISTMHVTLFRFNAFGAALRPINPSEGLGPVVRTTISKCKKLSRCG